MSFELTKGVDGSYHFTPSGPIIVGGGVGGSPAPAPVSPAPVSPAPVSPAPVSPSPVSPSPPPVVSPGNNVFIELCTPAHKDNVATFPVVFSNTTGEGYSRFTSKEHSNAMGGNVKTCFSLPFKVLPLARANGVNLPSFEVAPYQNSVSYDISISRQAGVFGEGSEFTALDQGTSPSVSFAPNAGAALILEAGDYFFNVGWAGQLAWFLAKPNGFNNNMSVIVRGADSLQVNSSVGQLFVAAPPFYLVMGDLE